MGQSVLWLVLQNGRGHVMGRDCGSARLVGQWDCMSNVDNGGREGLGWVGCVDRDGWEIAD